jgi:PhzF family phenazine biosynthesis protein
LFSGNPAGVVTDAAGLDDRTMQLIAREANLSETAFILPSTTKRADLQIRWFTPEYEVPLCGHATVAGFHALAEERLAGMKGIGTYPFRVQTKSGILKVIVEKKYSGSLIEFYLPLPKFRKLSRPPQDVMKTLGLTRSDLIGELPIVVDNYLYIPVKKLSTLNKIMPDSKMLGACSRRMKILGISIFTFETMEESSAFHSRFFAPAVGITEDPVTGSANGPLGAYLVSYALPRGQVLPSMVLSDGRLELIGEQGDVIGRKGRVKVRLRIGSRGPSSLAIAGEAVTVTCSDLHLRQHHER